MVVLGTSEEEAEEEEEKNTTVLPPLEPNTVNNFKKTPATTFN